MVDTDELFKLRLGESCMEAFESLQLAVWVIDDGGPSKATFREIACVVEFKGWQIQGSLTLRSTVQFFHDTHPTLRGQGQPPRSALLDWAGELTNQLLGRFKNKMLAHGLDFQLGVPVTVAGENLPEVGARNDDAIGYQFGTNFGIVSIRLRGKPAPGVHLLDAPVGKKALGPGRRLDM